MERFLMFSYIELILVSVLVVLFCIQILYYLISYMRPYRKMQISDKSNIAEQYPPVSVIVYAKNESYNLKKHLPALLEQNYPVYEIIVINDGSTDESDDVLKIFENDHKHLYHTFIPQESKYLSRRKLALTIGIKAAKHDILLFTEANCQPMTKEWITTMMRNYTDNTDILLGFCAYRKYKGFFHKLVSYDNLKNGLQYISSGLKNNPFSGNGRNLSYRKKLFFEHKGYSKSLSLHAGDDDLFVNEASTRSNTRVEYSRNSITEMAPIERFAIWKEMKVSRTATQHHYKGGQLTYYRMENFAFILFMIAIIISIIIGTIGNPALIIISILIYLILLITKGIILKKSSLMLQQKFFIGWLPILEIVHPMINVYIYIYRLFRGKKDYTFTIGGK